MSRPRIRSVKPEIWQDEKVGDLTHSARLLLLGLITMADDEGRLRALTSLILGHCFPYDEVPPAKLKKWVGEISEAGLILPYKVDGKPYIAFRHWKRHQKINRATPSELPPPPDQDIVHENSLNEQGDNTDDARPHAGARGSRSDPDPDPSFDELPKDLDPTLRSSTEQCVQILRRTAEVRGAKPVGMSAVARALESHPRKDHVAVAGDVEHWLTYGNGANRPAKDVVARFRRFLADSADVEAPTGLRKSPSAGMSAAHRLAEKAARLEAQENAA